MNLQYTNFRDYRVVSSSVFQLFQIDERSTYWSRQRAEHDHPRAAIRRVHGPGSQDRPAFWQSRQERSTRNPGSKQVGRRSHAQAAAEGRNPAPDRSWPSSGGRAVAVLAEDQELSPKDAAGILGISRPLVVHRMGIGDLPFRYVGKHRRTKLKDVLTLKARIDAQQAALDALADNTETLIRDHGL